MPRRARARTGGVTFPDHLASLLPKAVREAWETIVHAVPAEAYLVGGTAVAAHVCHRPSRDLHFFLERPADLDRVERTLELVGELAVTARNERTLNTVLDAVVVQFLDASDQHLVDPMVRVAGLRVPSIGDPLATKLNAITSRPALRDYVDLQAIEGRAHRYVEEGLALFVERYQPKVPDEAVAPVVRALASFEDVPPDPSLDVAVEDVAAYWTRRVREITRHLDRWG